MQKENKKISFRDIEFWSDRSISRFILTVPALTLCLVVAFLSIGINDIVGVVFNRFPVSTVSSVQSFFAFLRSNIPIIRVALVIPLLLFVNPKFRELTPTEITIASLVAIGGGYFLDLLPVETANGLIPSAFLLLWCIAWGIIQYDYQQKYNKELEIQEYLTKERIQELYEQYKDWQNKDLQYISYKLRIFLNSSIFKIPFNIRKITLKASRDTLRFLFVISLQASIFYVVNFWISSRIKDYYHYFLVGSLVVYLGVMAFHLIHRCLVETPVLWVIERMSDFAFNGLQWLDTPFEYVMSLNNLIAEKVILFTERQYTLSLRSRNPLVLISLAVANISIRTILLTIRILVSSLRIALNSLCFLFCRARIILTTIVIILISIIVFIFYSIMPFFGLVWNVLLEISFSLESNLRRRYLQWVLLIIWGLSINTLAGLMAIRVSGTYPWIFSITFATLSVSYLVFMFYGTLANCRTIEEEWNDIVEPLSERLAHSVFGFVLISWGLIGIDRIFQINYFNPQPDLVVITIILLALTIIVFIATLVSNLRNNR
ncbi:hypothetical protein [Dolichospermum sp. UHCC 0259]|uniref:hypothetical protein n=1 Tax=Dolichospermum sp. UHCC 0259 TaxID=2590010 RepID=UPI00144537B0|nr:hypothetical protein [Dolichospermum sp. UHCC 0259]MTJ47753.1 hypothetical protein [Dolichospermum sp. UHCC 0259]